MTLNDLSNSIYVINLKERIDRRENVINELKKIKCNEYTIIEGVDGKSVDNPSNIKNGAYGLLLTYKKIYEDWKLRNNENILIIEDDCVFIDDFESMLKSYIDNVPKNWEILYFGANHNYHIGSKTEKINKHCIKLNNSYSAHCVLMKNYVFEELINLIKVHTREVDVLLAALQKKYNSYSSSSALTTQTPSFSNIENKQIDNRWLIK